jgi:dihydrofolate reductase
MLDLSLMVAMTPERVIGQDGGLPWSMPSDLARFRKFTTEIGVVVMGRLTHDSIMTRNGKPLPGRTHIVVTRTNVTTTDGSVLVVRSAEEACETVNAIQKRACIIGGGQIYDLFLRANLVRKMFITTVYASVPGDSYFPDIALDEAHGWTTVYSEPRARHDSADTYDSSFEVYVRTVL